MTNIQRIPSLAAPALAVARSSERLVYRTIRGAKIACREWGTPGKPLCLGIHGLTSNSLCFADVASTVAAAGYHVIVPDLRGRNLSPGTGIGTYGWDKHARDAVAIADSIGAKTFGVIGHSMGAYIAMKLAVLVGPRLQSAVLMDALGSSEVGALQSISSAINRLDKEYESANTYVKGIKDKGVIAPFTKTWDRHFREELETLPNGHVKPRTDPKAVYEDTTYAVLTASNPAIFRVFWAALPKKTLVVRAGVPMAPVLGNIITELDAVSFKALRKDARFKTVDANHYTVMTEPSTVNLIGRFFRGDAI